MPYPYWSLLAAVVMPYVIAMYTVLLRKKQLGTIGINQPRTENLRLDDKGARAVAAQSNAWEALTVYAVSFLAAVSAGVKPEVLVVPATIFIICRVLHAIFYIANLAMLRGFAFMGGLGSSLYIISQAI